MASNTPNLNLLKKDPVTDGNDTFNIRTMLNENWDKIDAAVGEVREELQDIEIPNASLNKAGIVQLSNETSGSRENVAATEKAVSQAFQAGNERKAEVVAALVALGVSASTSETWAQLIPKMATIIKASGNATAADLLIGKTASNANGPFTGTMPDRGAATINPSGTAAVTIPDGAYKGAKVAQVSVPAAKVLNDTTIAGVKGTVPILTGVRNASGVAQWGDGALAVYPEAGYQKGGAGDGEIKVSIGQLQQAEPDLKPDNIISGVNILGVTGIALKIKNKLFSIGSKVSSLPSKATNNYDITGKDVNKGYIYLASAKAIYKVGSGGSVTTAVSNINVIGHTQSVVFGFITVSSTYVETLEYWDQYESARNSWYGYVARAKHTYNGSQWIKEYLWNVEVINDSVPNQAAQYYNNEIFNIYIDPTSLRSYLQRRNIANGSLISSKQINFPSSWADYGRYASFIPLPGGLFLLINTWSSSTTKYSYMVIDINGIIISSYDQSTTELDMMEIILTISNETLKNLYDNLHVIKGDDGVNYLYPFNFGGLYKFNI
ncbi:phage tail protein [Paenibacillus vini]|uniref:Tail fiber protein n=1 Tax=Paenibacillus vini TaxID=1476024 RepID=A0ABQ4MEL4_9BACL|nr:phage tail protein [Paenibacillus vini]GIP54436.1 hypothetical protein J42TS3_34710 [Paenibacillus vini]